MRVGVAFFVAVCFTLLFVIPRSVVLAEPEQDDTSAEKAAKPEKLAAKPKKLAKPEKLVKRGTAAVPNLRVQPTSAPSIDLFPVNVLGNSSRKPEKRKGVSLGDDSNWQTHVAQAGAMVALFGTLTALCANGGCKLPKALSAPVPDFLKSEPYALPPNPRRVQKIRSLR